MEALQIGERVRVINRKLVHHRQVGRVMTLGTDGGYYVHLDYDADRPDARTFFHVEELEAAPEAVDNAAPDQRGQHKNGDMSALPARDGDG
jgi:hypothetical protein